MSQEKLNGDSKYVIGIFSKLNVDLYNFLSLHYFLSIHQQFLFTICYSNLNIYLFILYETTGYYYLSPIQSDHARPYRAL